MSAYILVTADFPGITTEEREKIYQLLAIKKWNKIRELGRDISTSWYASFAEGIPEKRAIEVTIEEFNESSRSYCIPKLVIQWGPHKPTFHGLT